MELLNALLYLAVWQVYGLTFPALITAILFSVLIIIAFIDLAHQIIPDGLVLLIFILGVVNAIYQIVSFGVPWYTFVIGFFAASVPLFILGLIYPDGMGGGDIKLMAAAGLFMGWKLILLSLFIGSLYGGVVSIFIIAKEKGFMKSAIPLVPCSLSASSPALLPVRKYSPGICHCLFEAFFLLLSLASCFFLRSGSRPIFISIISLIYRISIPS